MRVRIQKWGNSLAVRIPKAFAESLNLETGTMAELSMHDGQIVIAPISNPYTLDELLAGITEDNKHGEISTGLPIGNEVW